MRDFPGPEQVREISSALSHGKRGAGGKATDFAAGPYLKRQHWTDRFMGVCLCTCITDHGQSAALLENLLSCGQ
jgi:hypothetical protein